MNLGFIFLFFTFFAHAHSVSRLELVACFKDACSIASSKRLCRATRWHSRSHTVSQRKSPGAKLCIWENEQCQIRDKINYRKSGRWAKAMSQLPKGCNNEPTQQPSFAPSMKPTSPVLFSKNQGFKCKGDTFKKIVTLNGLDCVNNCLDEIICEAVQFHPKDKVCLLKQNFIGLGSKNNDRICYFKN